MDELQDLRVLVIDPVGYSKNLLRNLMKAAGGAHVEAVTTTGEALARLRKEFFHLAFCDENAGPLPPPAFIKALRCDLQTRDVTVPVILVSAGTRRDKVAAWRDVGGSDVIVKPISLETIKLRLQALVLEPKSFVTAKSFIGPDRRRAREERRQFGERVKEPDRRGQSRKGSVFLAPARIKPGDPAPT